MSTRNRESLERESSNAPNLTPLFHRPPARQPPTHKWVPDQMKGWRIKAAVLGGQSHNSTGMLYGPFLICFLAAPVLTFSPIVFIGHFSSTSLSSLRGNMAMLILVGARSLVRLRSHSGRRECCAQSDLALSRACHSHDVRALVSF